MQNHYLILFEHLCVTCHLYFEVMLDSGIPWIVGGERGGGSKWGHGCLSHMKCLALSFAVQFLMIKTKWNSAWHIQGDEILEDIIHTVLHISYDCISFYNVNLNSCSFACYELQKLDIFIRNFNEKSVKTI